VSSRIVLLARYVGNDCRTWSLFVFNSLSSPSNTTSKSCSYAGLTSSHFLTLGSFQKKTKNLSSSSRFDSLGKKVEESPGVGTNELVGLLAIDKDLKGGHGADAELLGEVGEVVDVNLGEEDVLELLLVGVLGEERSNSFARAAPCGEAVEHDNLVLLEGRLPGVNGLDVVDSHFAGGGVERSAAGGEAGVVLGRRGKGLSEGAVGEAGSGSGCDGGGGQ